MINSMATNFLALPANAAQAAGFVATASLPDIQQMAALMSHMVVARALALEEDLLVVADHAFLDEGPDARGKFAELIASGQGANWPRLHSSYAEAVDAMRSSDMAGLVRIQGVVPIDISVQDKPAGMAEFVPLDRIQALLDSAITDIGRRAVAGGMMVFDTAMPAFDSPHAGLVRRMDHHGDMGDRADNTVGQLVKAFYEARAKAGIGKDETVTLEDDRLSGAIEALNIRFVSTDNLADGLDAVFMAQSQRIFLADPCLLELYAKAMRFVDFDAFSPAYADVLFEKLPDEVKLALAIYSIHDEAIKQTDLKFAGADRFAPENARTIAKWELPRLKTIVEDRADANLKALTMWTGVLEGAGHARTNAVIGEMTVGDAVVGYLYNNSAMKDYGYFAAQMAFARAHPSAAFYTKVIEFPAAGVVRENSDDPGSKVTASSRILIAALPYGRTFPNGETMRGEILAALKKAHEDKARELGVQTIPDAGKWAIRDDVIVTVGGTFLTPQDMKVLIEGKLANLFVPRN